MITQLQSERIPLVASALVVLALAAQSSPQDCTTVRASVSSSGAAGTGESFGSDLSSDGRFVAFQSYASNLAPGDQNAKLDGFVRDLSLDLTERISVPQAGGESNGHSGGVTVSDDGRYACFLSAATNMHPEDTNSLYDVYLRDRVAGTTTLVSKRLPGKPSVSETGAPELSGNGRFIIFYSDDPGFVQGDTNTLTDIFLWDRLTGSIERVSIGPNGQQGLESNSGPSGVSDDGRFVAFPYAPNNWGWALDWLTPQIFVRDRLLQTTELVSVTMSGQPSPTSCGSPDISGDGKVVVFQCYNGVLTPQDNPPKGWHIYARDLEQQQTTLVSLNKDGVQTLAGHSDARTTYDGRLVLFGSYINDLVAQDWNIQGDIFMHDRSTSVTTLVSLGDRNQFASGPGAPCNGGMISGDGKSVLWTSLDNKLVQAPCPFTYQVYVRTCSPDPAAVYCAALDNSLGCAPIVKLTGASSATAGSGHVLDCSKLVSGSIGLLYYGTQGPLAAPVAGFYQCVKPPILRMAAQSTGGPTFPPNCSGQLSFDFNAWIATGSDPSLVAGSAVYAQFWSRDPQAVSTMHFSPAVAFLVGP